MPTTNATIQAQNGTEDTPSYKPMWFMYLEAVLLAFLSIGGLTGNIVVMRSSVKMNSFAKQNLILFFALAICDLTVCGVRMPSLIYILLIPVWDTTNVVCDIWMFSFIFVVIANITNMILGLQRLLIMYSFTCYRKYITMKFVLIVTLAMWIIVLSVSVAIYKLLGFSTSLIREDRMCLLQSPDELLSITESAIFRITLVSIVGFAPIIVSTISYNLIILRICRAGLTRLDRFDETANYSRVTYIALFRVAILFCLWSPYLLVIIIAPEFPDALFPVMRYFDYLFCLQSVVIPFVTIQDSDFKETINRQKWLSRYCTTINSSILRNNSSRRSRRHGTSGITSAELRTYKHTEPVNDNCN